MENIIIYGETEFAERIFSYIKFENAANVLAFTNARSFKQKESIQGVPVIAFEDLSKEFIGVEFKILIAIGYSQMNNIRKKIYEECKNSGYNIATYISKTVIKYSSDIEEGCIIMPNVYIGPNCKIGRCNIFESSSCLSHDNKFGDFNFISTSVTFGGYSTVKNNCFIGLNCTIKDNITIEYYSLIGSASNLLKNTEKHCVYVGNPARKLGGKKSKETKI